MLLKPNKNANPDLTILAASSLILTRLRKSQFETITDLRLVLHENNKDSTSLLESSLEFLFLLGLIEYHQKNDLIEYIGS
ncbi:ABC-three component system middle component 8 [Photobacterium leiognathi]|uniref:ABC-three component system middle component 8 n=1 Tax=Photobacterium leiognathi TaxID=553611 RepID=UPI0034E4F142